MHSIASRFDTYAGVLTSSNRERQMSEKSSSDGSRRKFLKSALKTSLGCGAFLAPSSWRDPFPVQVQLTRDDWMKNLGSLPLIYQPGKAGYTTPAARF
jgi:hypothetical protein